ncbi:MAG: hypothetical protein KME57_27305 [Scytonema hyalinum WJT4-NPBG1]|nr:hypothetical protein [Scytonema hyalinum WJT4-NPBG1]
MLTARDKSDWYGYKFLKRAVTAALQLAQKKPLKGCANRQDVCVRDLRVVGDTVTRKTGQVY